MCGVEGEGWRVEGEGWRVEAVGSAGFTDVLLGPQVQFVGCRV